MAECEFDQHFTGSAADLVARAKKGIHDQKGTFNGDATHGSFSVPTGPFTSNIEGTYTVTGQTAHFIITSKPFLVSCGTIQTGIAQASKGSASEDVVATPAPPPRTKPTPSGKARPAKKASKAKVVRKATKAKKARPGGRAKKSRPARRSKRGARKR